MDPLRFVRLLALCACLWPTCTRGSVSDCCEGDLLLLLDSSGSIKSYEFFRLQKFLSELLQPFLLGRGQVRVALVQVGTEPRLEFGLDTYDTQSGLQDALSSMKQLCGDTNTEQALQLFQSLLSNDSHPEAPPRVLLWLTDGVGLGAIDRPMAALQRMGVSVLALSMGNGNYQLLRRVVTPPIEKHLYFVDIDYISSVTEDLTEALIDLIRAERLQVRDLRSRSAVLQWRPVLSGGLGNYSLHYKPDPSDGTAASISIGPGSNLTLPGDFSWAELTNLQPDTSYTAWLVPENNIRYMKTLSVSFRTLPERFGPATVMVSDSGPDGLRVSWSPVQPEQVQQYRVEYGEIPIGPVRNVTLPSYQSSALLTQLLPDTEYLITVTALHSSGQQRAMSVRGCTREDLPPLADLKLTPVGRGSVQVDWQGQGAGLLGYWVSWKREDQPSSSSSSLFLPPHSLSTRLTELGRGSRVCVSPVYLSARGEGLCCTAHA
ncbi:von Willebrand factor A domain-containing protein 1-like [Ctenopharyngodon idella]|uniref:von Willebrand factor A domain-containing protein 1-like n=1 Tax=Ctenopharyngodon idella TaxID=7959 RepID=UPI0022313C83|nr:von Willebrand factor A domain-containing protein 1-like [Ctenopharyngodon idella]XP_051766512.1 von Willebrand factor A domain-containing protein 1-like [Ctenopharyngodon idella]